jgi:uncharacterized membrane protein YeaQ/YmgE (transglycosylase-associated protein family)
VGQLRFNLYTGPAFLACIMNLFGAIILVLVFKEVYAGLHQSEIDKLVAIENSDSNSKSSSKTVTTQACFFFKGNKQVLFLQGSISSLPSKLPPYDLIACFVCYLSRFTQMFVQTNVETIGSPFSMTMFGWTEQKAVEIISIVQALVGAITFATYIFYINFKSSKIEFVFFFKQVLQTKF